MFMSAFAIIIAQVVYVGIIFNYFYEHELDFGDISAGYLIFIPRLLSSLMMHMMVVPDARQGLNLMKFAVNHPWMFRYSNDEIDEEHKEEAEQLFGKESL